MRRQPRPPRPSALLRRTVLFTAILLVFSSTAARAWVSPPVAVTPELDVFRQPAAAGSVLQVGGYGFPASSEMRLGLICLDATFALGMAFTDDGTRPHTAIIVPAASRDLFWLNAYGRTVLASAPTSMLPAVQWVLSPQTAPSGTALRGQHASAADSMRRSRSGWLLGYGGGAAIDTRETLKTLPISLTSVEEYVRRLYPAI